MVFALSDVKNFRAIIIKTAGTGAEIEWRVVVHMGNYIW